MSEWILKSRELDYKLRNLSFQVYDNPAWRSVRALRDLAGILKVEKSSSLTLDPLFSFSLLNMYIYAKSFSQSTLNDVVEATVITMGRAFRNIIGNTLEIEDLREFKQKNNIKELFPKDTKESKKEKNRVLNDNTKGLQAKNQRRQFYKNLGINLTSCLKNGNNNAYEGTYPYLLLKLLVEEGLKKKWNPDKRASEYLNERDLSKISFQTDDNERHKKERSLLEYLLLLLADLLNTSPDSVPRYFNYRLLNHHLMRDVLYALYFRLVFKKIIERIPVFSSFNFDLLNFDLDSPSFKGLSGNTRIVDDFLYGMHVGKRTIDFLVKVLNIGISPENILQSWIEARNDLGYSKYPSLLFIPVYPDPTFWGGYQKFLMDRHARGDGHVVVFFLPTFYDILRFLTYYSIYAKDVEAKKNVYMPLYWRIGYYIKEVIE